jgi:hypothetical protein
MHYTTTAGLQNYWHCYRQWSWYHITVYRVNTTTHAVHWLTKMLWFQKVPISNITLNLNHSEFYWTLSCFTSYYVTTTSFLTLPIHYKVIITQWSDELIENKKNLCNVFMCEPAVTVELYRAVCSLSDADAHFFRIRRISVRAVCLMSVPLHNKT